MGNNEREILYKAKSADDGKWVEGFLIHHEYLNGSSPCIGHLEGDFTFVGCLVSAGTVSQYIGRTDKKGKKIFENDIVKQPAYTTEAGDSRYYYYIIRYNNENACFEGVEIGESKESFLMADLEDVEVVGNIFDKPELISAIIATNLSSR